MDWQTMAMFFGWGAASGVIGAMAKSRRLRLPRVVRRVCADGGDAVEVDTGFLLAPALGGVMAMVMDGRPVTALAWGLACGYAGPAVVNSVVDAVMRKLGIETDELPREADGAAEEP